MLKSDYGAENIEEEGYGSRPRFDFLLVVQNFNLALKKAV